MRVNTRYVEDAALVAFMYLVFTRVPEESYRRRLGFSVLSLCGVFRTPINCFVSGVFSKVTVNATSTETIRTVRDGELRTATSTSVLLYVHRDHKDC